jgi:hypothetical protein
MIFDYSCILKLAISNQLLVTGYLRKKSWLLVASYLNKEKLATSSQLLRKLATSSQLLQAFEHFQTNFPY